MRVKAEVSQTTQDRAAQSQPELGQPEASQPEASRSDESRPDESQPTSPHSDHGKSHHGYANSKDEYTARLRRIEGQVRGLQRMVAEDKYCIDILTQVSAATRALQSVALGLLSDHLAHCVAQAVAEGGPAADEKVREATAAIARLVRS
ncbi:metal-sensitive transcriptional regulator [Frankia sp. Mgl5]|uniref:metal-sensitive transcriptional regulator n=1 Tax=Frankia sp. Mgl5 TaxID=2933793 RepID=UPI0034D69F9C